MVVFGKKSPKFYIFKYNYLLITISHIILSLLSCSSTSATSYIRNYNTGTLKIACYWMMDERGHLLAIIKKYQKTVSRTPMSQWERLSLLSPVKRGDDTEFYGWLLCQWRRNYSITLSDIQSSRRCFFFCVSGMLAPRPPPVWPSPGALRTQQLRFWRAMIVVRWVNFTI